MNVLSFYYTVLKKKWFFETVTYTGKCSLLHVLANREINWFVGNPETLTLT